VIVWSVSRRKLEGLTPDEISAIVNFAVRR
jgi:hypothetical protein